MLQHLRLRARPRQERQQSAPLQHKDDCAAQHQVRGQDYLGEEGKTGFEDYHGACQDLQESDDNGAQARHGARRKV